MATMYFCTETGDPFSANAVTGDDGVARGQAIKATNAPDNIAEWRMTYNFETNSVDVYGGTDKTDDEATQQQKDENAAANVKWAEEEAARIAAMSG